MANKNNLIPQAHKLTVEEQSKGGKKSVKSKKEKKYIKENLEALMLLDLKDIRLKNKMFDLGAVEDVTIQNAICCAVVQQALNGNLKAFQIIVDMMQQNPKFGDDKEHIENIIFINDIPRKLKEKKELDLKE